MTKKGGKNSAAGSYNGGETELVLWGCVVYGKQSSELTYQGAEYK